MSNPLNMTLDEVTAIVGQQHLEIVALRKQNAALQAKVVELTPKPKEDKDGGPNPSDGDVAKTA